MKSITLSTRKDEGSSQSMSDGVDIIPTEEVQAGGKAMIDVLTAVFNKIWKTWEWPTTWNHSLIITLPQKGHLKACQNYRTIRIISHPSKARLQPQDEEIIAQEQGGAQEQRGLRAVRSTT